MKTLPSPCLRVSRVKIQDDHNTWAMYCALDLTLALRSDLVQLDSKIRGLRRRLDTLSFH